ncbi:hypothetical protein [Rhodoligotrophos defluvii]|uniref:hypothetical protein n=1 Tax=Rhodoligotrophos defluvii TaxID=2561934 RepID=UPI0010C9FFA2|nr:hypothetical protein [Rhodoligotrophos defluvii]
MAYNDERDSKGGQDRPGRRPPVIDLRATEIKPDKPAAAAASSSEDAEPEASIGVKAGPQPDDAAAAQPTATGDKPAETTEGNVGAGEEDLAGGDGSPPPEAGEDGDARVRQWLRGGIAALLFTAGLLGGILLYRTYGNDYFPSPQIQDMLARLPALEQAARDNRNRLDTFSEALESLKARVTTVEEAATGLRQDVNDVRARVDDARALAQRLDSALTELRESGASASPANADAIAELRQATEAAAARLQTVESELGMLRQAQNDTGAAGQSLSQLTQRLEALEHTLQTRLQAEQQREAERAAAATAIAASLDSLRSKLANGEPFRNDFDSLRNRIGGSPELERLEPYADQGVPTHQTLQQRFATIRQNLEQAAARSEPEPASGTWDALVHRLRSIVQVRPVDEVDWLEVTGRMQPYVGAGDYAAAMRIAQAAGAAPPPALADWMQAARARSDADEALARVTSQALEQIQTMSGSMN